MTVPVTGVEEEEEEEDGMGPRKRDTVREVAWQPYASGCLHLQTASSRWKRKRDEKKTSHKKENDALLTGTARDHQLSMMEIYKGLSTTCGFLWRSLWFLSGWRMTCSLT